MLLLLLVFLNIIATGWCKIKLPDDIHQCTQSDPHFGQCVVNISKYILPKMVSGDKKYHIPALNPLTVPLMDVDSGQLHLTINDVLLYGLDDVQLNTFNLDNVERVVRASLYFPRLSIQGQYHIDGRVLILPISGHGPVNITIINGTYDMTLPYTLMEKNDHYYAKFIDTTSEYNIKRVFMSFGGLFGGNDQLSDQMNKLLNDNWRDVMVEVGPAMNDAFRGVLVQVVNGILERVPFDVLFPA